ncbi:hypothetical protein M426DRAFT_320300 [Hypoxylon sp. CI-4A]|nr:hypothetical protein M426DRAFT_320300 [Hypoxylon sp. CI-4A]
MASVTSLDKDLRKLRLEKYTPAAANEARSWIENALGTRLPSNDLLDGLKDGVALCKLINLAVGPPGVKFKQSAMPFIQMENISHFLRACQSPPLNLQDHDVFLTVDLYERKDPAQVLQCLGAFSRAANSVNPSAFPFPIGPKARGAAMSPQNTGPITPRNRGTSNVSNNSSNHGSRPAILPTKTGDSGSGRWSPTKSPTPTSERVGSPNVSSWSKRDHEGITSPAWNIAQYGYMGGASQGNLGISFGGRRQITTAGPHVPNIAEKERRRKEQEAEAERQRMQAEQDERVRKAKLEAAEERARIDEERRWEEETNRQRVEEKRKAEEEKHRWEEEERQWRLTEEKRRKEEEEAEAKLNEERQRAKSPRLQGQFLSQYQAEQGLTPQTSGNGYTDRIKQLEQELELARKREQEYEEERQRRSSNRARSRSRPKKQDSRPPSRQDSWRPRDDQHHFLSTQWNRQQEQERERKQQIEQEKARSPPQPPPRPLPVPGVSSTSIQTHRTGETPPPLPVKPQRTGEGRPLPIPNRLKNQVTGNSGPSPPPRPLPVPSANPGANRTDRFLSSNPAPAPPPPQQTYSRELGATEERDAEDRRRAESQAKTKAAGWAGKSLLEREMEMERQRQREWEEAQEETAKAVRTGDGVDGVGGGVGGRWDVSQWSGFTGGDSQNKGSAGIGSGRRQIVGPRPLPSRPGS